MFTNQSSRRSDTPLPMSLKELETQFIVSTPLKRTTLPPVSPIVSAAEDMYKVRTLNNARKSRVVGLLRILKQMILLIGTRGEEVAEWAWRLFPYFTEEELALSLQRLRQAGIIVKARGREGVRFQLSDR